MRHTVSWRQKPHNCERMLRVTFLLLLFMGWNQSDGARNHHTGRGQETEVCHANVTSKAGMTARMYCCLGVTNKGAEVRYGSIEMSYLNET